MKAVIIVGSARKNGNTKQVSEKLATTLSCDLLDLTDYKIAPYSYEHNYLADDFIMLMTKILGSYDTLIFATPVYWYSMSGIMKTFLDRFTDLLKIEKEIGRQLRSKNMAVLTSSNGGNLESDFWIPFKHTAEYLGMNYLGNLHTLEDQDAIENLLSFSRALKSNWEAHVSK